MRAVPGKYIAFEGVEGCGKSTHVKRLAAHLDALITREPGGTPVGDRIRAIADDVADRPEAVKATTCLGIRQTRL